MKKDFGILITTLILTFIGILMVYSASSIWAEYKFGRGTYYLTRQLLFAGVGIILMLYVSKIDYHYYKLYATEIFFLCVFLLFVVLIPGIGIVRGGARSWVGVGQFSIQPSEFMKLGLCIFLSKYLSVYHKDIKSFKELLKILFIIVFVFGIIMLQPDFGTGMVIVISMIIMLFIAGVNIKYFIYISLIGIAGVVGLIVSAPYRIQRILAFLDPWQDPLGSGFQTIQSLYALVPGGIFGLGLFNSRQKFFYLPEPQTDFIFAIIVEELGLIGGIFVLILFIIFIYRGILISIKCKDLFGQFLSLGIVSIIFVQVFINIGVVIGLLPVTGITLPFLSYGGSSLTLTLISIGVLLNISKNIKKEYSSSI